MTRSRLRPPRIALCFVVLVAASTATAHPLGNTTVNRQAQLSVGPQQIAISYLLELAEIPTLLAGQDADRNGDGVLDEAEWQAYARDWAQRLIPQLTLSIDGRPRPLTLSRHTHSLQAGAAGLQQLRLQARYVAAPAPAAERFTLDYHDASRPQERGWREIWLQPGPGLRVLQADIPQHDRSEHLQRFPAGADDIPDELSAHLELALAAAPRPALRPAPDRAEPAPSAPSPPAPASQPPAAQPAAESIGTPPAAAPAGAFAFFLLGIHHIASGWDHLVFLLGLLLVAQGLGQLIRIVTAFTVAHSLTLACAASGLVHLADAIVEPAIALTIAYVGLANLFWRRQAHGVVLAFGFGQIHGFGFAGALADSLAASPPASLAWLGELAAFNLGIEAFQLALISAALPLLRAIERYAWAAHLRHLLAIGILASGAGWFALRL